MHAVLRVQQKRLVYERVHEPMHGAAGTPPFNRFGAHDEGRKLLRIPDQNQVGRVEYKTR